MVVEHTLGRFQVGSLLPSLRLGSPTNSCKSKSSSTLFDTALPRWLNHVYLDTRAPIPLLRQGPKMQRDTNNEAHQVASRHYQELRLGPGSSSPSSSASSSPRVAAYIDHQVFDNPVGPRAQGSAATASSPAEPALKSPSFCEGTTAPGTDEGWSGL